PELVDHRAAPGGCFGIVMECVHAGTFPGWVCGSRAAITRTSGVNPMSGTALVSAPGSLICFLVSLSGWHHRAAPAPGSKPGSEVRYVCGVGIGLRPARRWGHGRQHGVMRFRRSSDRV
ncbi:MAG: hypothetical protein ACR2GH_19845, partial [Pseudonocardia sp.]